MIYLDYNATTPVDKRVIDAMLPYLEEYWGNPSSIYQFAKHAERAKEEAREELADLLSAKPEEIIFTSSATEANNFAIKGVAFANKERGNHIITSAIEHKAVLEVCKYLQRLDFEVTYIPVDRYGVVDVEELKSMIRPGKTILITIMHANNEVGTIQPIEEITKLAKEYGIYFHTDAAQTVGKIPTDVEKLGVDLLSISAHKFYGPKGVGALYIKKGTKIDALLHGGGHERGMRSSTENVAGIVGLGKAAEIAKEEMDEDQKKIKVLRDRLERLIVECIDDVLVNGHPKRRLFNTINICVRGVEGESMLLNLDLEGICASTGSACTSGSLEPSHVLLAMGIPYELAQSSVRFSLGKYNTEEEIDKTARILKNIVERLRQLSPL
jgi:cysteine desulfurase